MGSAGTAGDDIYSASQKIIEDFEDAFDKLNRLRQNDAGAGTSTADMAAFQWKIDTSSNPPTVLMGNAEGTAFIRMGYLSEYFGLDAEKLGAVTKGGDIGKVSLGRESLMPNIADTYDIYIAWDTARVYLYVTGAWRVFLSLQFGDMMNVSNTVVTKEEVGRSGSNMILQLNSVGQGEIDITGSPGKLAGKNMYVPNVNNNDVLAFNEATQRWEAVPNAATIGNKPVRVNSLAENHTLVYDATNERWVNKEVPIVTEGVLNANISGSAAKWSGRSAFLSALQDGQVLVWSESNNCFVNRDQRAVGNARSLVLSQDENLLAEFNGDERKVVNIVTPHLRLNSHVYEAGDACFSKNLSYELYLKCTTGGLSANAEPDYTGIVEGDTVTDGTVVWTVCKKATNKQIDDIQQYLLPNVILSRSTAYSVGDIAYSSNLPSYLRLECVVPGTTGTTEPDFSGMSAGGGIIVDGTCTFIVDDVRDGTPVGQVRASMYLPAGYVKLEGGTVNRSNYPRLVALADTYNLWTDDATANPGLFGEGNGSTTMVLPNWTGRMAQFAATAGNAVAAGLPNITGLINIELSQNGNICVSDPQGAINNRSGWGYWSTAGKSGDANVPAGISFNASRSNPIYSASQTVQPPAINTFAIMRY